MAPRTTQLDALFPLSSEAPSSRAPVRLPGVTRLSSDALVKTLKNNHVKWHAFFNDMGAHNHASHHLVAIYAIGASGPAIEEAYHTHVVYMRPALESPEPVNGNNFWQHLGKREFYNSYLEYFRDLLEKKGITEVIEEYIFSVKANIGGVGIDGHPRLLNRFLAGLLHPIIHVGNGLEFGILGLVAEGLAQSAVHPDDAKELFPPSLFQSNSTIAALAALLPSLTLNKAPTARGNTSMTDGKTKTGVHAFTILARLLADDSFAPASIGLPPSAGENQFSRVNTTRGDPLVKLTNEWAGELEGDGATADTIAKKIEELAWMNALVYGAGGWMARERSPTKKFYADFFYMHLVTSTVFLPSIVAYLSPCSAVLLLKAYFSTSISWYLAQGRPSLPIREFYAAVTDKPAPPGKLDVAPHKDTLTPDDVYPNPWLPIVQTAIVHPAEHLCKIQRALMHNATLYGTRAAGDFAGLELDGAEVLDGTFFIRTAGLTADRLGWMKEGQDPGNWDRVGFW